MDAANICDVFCVANAAANSDAERRHPSKCEWGFCVWEGFADFYRELSHNGGIYNTFAQNWYDMQIKTVQYGLGTKGYRSRMNGDWVSGPETLSDEALGGNRYDLGRTYFSHPMDDDYYKAMFPGLVQDQGAAVVGCELGRTATASSRQFRGLLPVGHQAEVARGARDRALDALLHRLRRRSAEAVLRLLSQGREERMEQAAAGAAQHPSSRRKVRHSPRGRLADPAHAVDQVSPRERCPEAHDRAGNRLSDRDVRRARQRRHLPHRADAGGDRDHRSGRRQACTSHHRRRMRTSSWCCGCSRPT